MPGPVHKYNNDFVITNVGDLKNNHHEYSTTTWNITFSNYEFTPSNLTIQAGDEVVYIAGAGSVAMLLSGWAGNDSDDSVTYVADERPFGAVLMHPTTAGYIRRISYKFLTEGVFYYYCALHPSSMYGYITVEGAPKSSESSSIVPISRSVRGPSSLRTRKSAYTPSKGGNPLEMGN